MNEQLVLFAMQRIRSYLQRAPRAADTVSGIHSFWIEWTEPVPSQAITLEALQRLASTGLVERVAIGTSELWRKVSDLRQSLPESD